MGKLEKHKNFVMSMLKIGLITGFLMVALDLMENLLERFN